MADALKEMFNEARYRQVARLLAEEYPEFDSRRFLAHALPGLAELTLIQRLRRMTEAIHSTLPADYLKALAILKGISPRVDQGFVSLFLCDFVGLYGQDHFAESMIALEQFTSLGSAEFAIRGFLKRDLSRTLATMNAWAGREDHHLRRLASEGGRPRLPWSFRLPAVLADPTLVWPILETLKADPHLYVRKSVANHLNDISKDHPDWLLAKLKKWDLSNPHTKWIVKHSLRTLIKRGDPRALALIGATRKPAVKLNAFSLSPARVPAGGEINFSFSLGSQSKSSSQRLVVDYVVHYMKKSGETSPKVFKLKELTLAAGTTIAFAKRHRLQELSTRRHHAGRHRVEIMVNGAVVAGGDFVLLK